MLTLDAFQVYPPTPITEPPALTLRISYNQDFLDVNDLPVLGASKNFYVECPCSVSAGIITVGATDIFTTLDANVQNPQAINCTGRFFSGNAGKDYLFSQWVVPSEAEYPGGVITFAQLTIYNTGANTLANPPSTYLTEAETIAYFSTLSPAQDASATIKGITKLSVAPAVAIEPIAYGANDPNVTVSTTTSQEKSIASSAATSNSVNISVADSKAVSDSVVISSLTTTSNSKIASNSLNISVADSKAVSDSITTSTADSKGTSAGLAASVADSKALSGSLNTSTADSKGVSAGTRASVADSKAVSDSILTSTADSKGTSAGLAASTADSKAVSDSVLTSTAQSGVVSGSTGLSTLTSRVSSKGG